MEAGNAATHRVHGVLLAVLLDEVCAKPGSTVLMGDRAQRSWLSCVASTQVLGVDGLGRGKPCRDGGLEAVLKARECGDAFVDHTSK